MTVSHILREKAREDEAKKRWQYQQYQQKQQGYENALAEQESTLFSQLRSATLAEYATWLCGFVKAGGVPTSYTSYKSSRFGEEHTQRWSKEFYWGSSWYSTRPGLTKLVLVPRYGAASISIIVPVGVTTEGEYGHSNLFFLDGYHYRGEVPVYPDVIDFLEIMEE